MSDHISAYLHKHTRALTVVVVIVFLLLASGEFYLYRKVTNINRMISEGLMQLKETKPKEYLKIKTEAVMKNGKVAINKVVETQTLDNIIYLPDGTKLAPDGKIIKQNGEKVVLKEGEAISLE